MIKAEYQHCSMAGSYWIDCEVLGFNTSTNKVLVSYHDFLIDEKETRWVPYDYIRGCSWPSLLANLKTS